MTKHTLPTVTEATFEAEVLRSSMPYLVEFSAPWCGACKVLAPVVADVAHELDGRLSVGVVDTEASPSLGSRYGVTALPTVILFQGGKEVARRRGTMPRSTLREMVIAAIR